MNEYKLMIVDDEPDILVLLEKALNIEGFSNIVKITDGLTAVDTCKGLIRILSFWMLCCRILTDMRSASLSDSFQIVLFCFFLPKTMK